MELIKHCLDECWETLKQVADPEIPVLSVVDLGMIRGVELNEEDQIIVRLTPTYSGCPATDLLKAEITCIYCSGFGSGTGSSGSVRSLDY